MLSKLSPSDKQGGKRYSVLTSISFTSEPDVFFFRFYCPLVFLFFFSWKLSLHVFLKFPFLLYVFSLLLCKIHFSRWYPSNPQEENTAKVQRRAWEDGEQNAPRLLPQPSFCPVVGSILPSSADQRPYLLLPGAIFCSLLELGFSPFLGESPATGGEGGL